LEIYIGENVLSAICAQIMLSAQGAELKEFNGLRRAAVTPAEPVAVARFSLPRRGWV